MTKDTVEDLFAAARVAVPAPPLGLAQPSFFFSSSLTRAGLALPLVAFMA